MDAKTKQELYDAVLKLTTLKDQSAEPETVGKLILEYKFELPIIGGPKFEGIELKLAKGLKKTDNNETTEIGDVDLDVTGNPLPNPFTNDNLEWSEHSLRNVDQSFQYQPLDLDMARCLLSWFIQTYSKHDQGQLLPAMWALCDGTQQNTVILGIRFFNNSMNRIVLNCIPCENVNSLLKFEELERMHMIGMITEKCENTASTTFGISTSDNDVEKEVLLKFDWTDCTRVLQPPPSTSTCYTQLSTAVNKPSSYAYQQFKELEHLEHVVKKLETSDVKSNVVHCDVLKESLHNTLQAFSAGKTFEQYKNHLLFLPSTCSVLPYSLRNELDCTDVIWLALRDFNDMNDLEECFRYIFSLPKSEHLQKLFKNNTTDLANILNGTQIVPDLHSTTVKKLMIQIGLAKLYRDYVYFFHGNKLAQREQILPLLKSKTSIRDKLSCLKMLQVCMELVIKLAVHLKLEIEQLRLFVREMLTSEHYYNQSKVEYPLKVSDVIPLINWKQCIRWQVTLKSTEPTYGKKSTFTVNCDNFCDWINVKAQPFYCFLCTEIEDGTIL